MTDEDIDAETLQAQIDLSMSFAQNLVSSWMKPSPSTTTSRPRNIEAELKEYMRRPPRLGVGATVSESSAATSQEAARLKGRLLGKANKRAREDEHDIGTATVEAEDDGESRASAIRKKPRLDPFDNSKKGKKPQVNGILT
ncbi:hypothetical protein C8J56DRAFT_759063, partial [Mycena floridula]